MKRIGIFGGSFDPPHFGHLAVAQAALRSGSVDEVWLMVSPQNPFKVGKRMTPEQTRVEMTRILLQQLSTREKERIKVSDFEFALPRPTYTLATLDSLSSTYPDCSFRLIIGGDNLEAFARWKNPEKIIARYGLIVYPRPGYPLPDMTQMDGKCVILEDVEMMGESSSEIRRRINAGLPVDGLLPRGVIDYISAVSLYMQEEGSE